MDENRTLEEKCENLMNIVVDSRKKFGKMCGEFGEKIVYYETEMLKLQNIASCRSKIKTNYIPKNNTDGMEKDLEDFKNEMLLSQRSMHELQQNVKDMQSIVLQLKNDAIGRKLRKKITADALLVEAKKEENMHK